MSATKHLEERAEIAELVEPLLERALRMYRDIVHASVHRHFGRLLLRHFSPPYVETGYLDVLRGGPAKPRRGADVALPMSRLREVEAMQRISIERPLPPDTANALFSFALDGSLDLVMDDSKADLEAVERENDARTAEVLEDVGDHFFMVYSCNVSPPSGRTADECRASILLRAERAAAYLFGIFVTFLKNLFVKDKYAVVVTHLRGLMVASDAQELLGRAGVQELRTYFRADAELPLLARERGVSVDEEIERLMAFLDRYRAALEQVWQDVDSLPGGEFLGRKSRGGL